jgi:hypothetical protein
VTSELNTNAAAYWIIPLSRMMTANYAPDATKAISSDTVLWMRATASLFGYADGSGCGVGHYR